MGSTLKPAQQHSEAIFRGVRLEVGRRLVWQICPSPAPHIGGATTELTSKGAAEFRSIIKAALLGDLYDTALIVGIGQCSMSIKQTSMLDVMHDSAKRLKQAIEPRT
jgi:hypothetical protein